MRAVRPVAREEMFRDALCRSGFQDERLERIASRVSSCVALQCNFPRARLSPVDAQQDRRRREN